MADRMRRIRHLLASLKLPSSPWLSAISLAALCVFSVCVNVLAHRFSTRWDLTRSRLFTLSGQTMAALGAVKSPIQATIFLSRSDPLFDLVRHTLATYQAESKFFTFRVLDPDRDPVRFMAVQAEFGMEPGRAEDGRVLSDAVVVLSQSNEHWFVTADRLAASEPGEISSSNKLEQALTEGILSLSLGEPPSVCLTRGHQELSTEDFSSEGLLAFERTLGRANYQVTSVDLTPPLRGEPFAQCDVVVVASPGAPFSNAAATLLTTYSRRGGSVLALLPPAIEAGRVAETGLEPWLASLDIRLGADVVIESDAELRLPVGLGESFFANSEPHALTQGLARPGSKVQYRLLVSSAQSVERIGMKPELKVTPLIASTASSFSLRELSPFVRGDRLPTTQDAAKRGPFALAFAIEPDRGFEAPQAHRDAPDHAPPAGGKQANPKPGPHAKPQEKVARTPETEQKQSGMNPGRAVVVGAGNLAWSRSFQDPTWAANALFLESAISWLSTRPVLVQVPEKAPHPAGLSLSEASLRQVGRYVLVYMPLSIVFLGTWVLFRRYRKEQRAQRRERRSPG